MHFNHSNSPPLLFYYSVIWTLISLFPHEQPCMTTAAAVSASSGASAYLSQQSNHCQSIACRQRLRHVAIQIRVVTKQLDLKHTHTHTHTVGHHTSCFLAYWEENHVIIRIAAAQDSGQPRVTHRQFNCPQSSDIRHYQPFTDREMLLRNHGVTAIKVSYCRT